MDEFFKCLLDYTVGAVTSYYHAYNICKKILIFRQTQKGVETSFAYYSWCLHSLQIFKNGKLVNVYNTYIGKINTRKMFDVHSIYYPIL